MRNFAARFVRHAPAKPLHLENAKAKLDNPSIANVLINPVYVVDPNLDLRRRFQNVNALRENLNARRITTTMDELTTIQDNYMNWFNVYQNYQWLKAYQNYSKYSAEYEETKLLLFKARSELLDQSSGLLAALALPNDLDQPSCSNSTQIEQKITSDERIKGIINAEKIRELVSKGSSVLLQRFLRNSLFQLAKVALESNMVPLSTSNFVRPALVECCNIGLEEYPMVTDGIDSPMCLAGVDLPSFMPLLVKHQFSRQNQWPITLVAYGSTYQFSLDHEPHQTQRVVFFTLGRNEEESTEAQNKIQGFLNAFFSELFKNNSKLKIIFENLPPRKLKKWERSAVEACWEQENYKMADMARFSNIGDYLSRRGNTTFAAEVDKNENSQEKDPHYLQMKFASLNLDSITQCLLMNNE